MRRVVYLVSVFAALTGLTLFGGAMHGQFSGRWGPPSQLRVAGGTVADLPPDFVGDNWECTLSRPLGKVEVDELHCTGHWARRYVNRTTGEAVDVSLIVGPPGRVAVHTPEVCLGWRCVQPRKPMTLPEDHSFGNTFWDPIFESEGPNKTRLRVYYAWRVDGPWAASRKTRYVFAGSPLLFKVQASCVLPPGADDKSSDGAQAFLQDFVSQTSRLDIFEQAPRIQVLVQTEVTDDSGEKKTVETEVLDGSGSVDFGTTSVGKPIERTFVINNVGTRELKLDSASLDAPMPDGFSVTKRFNETVPGGGSTEFKIRLDATKPGSYAGTLSFGNNDSDESPYEFTVSGEIVARDVEN